MAKVRTYACKKVLISFGPISISGKAEGSFFEVSPSGEGTQKIVGCGGEVGRSLDPDTTFTGKISLLQTSDEAARLQQFYTMDQETGLGVYPLTVTNLMGGEIFSCAQAWIKNSAVRNYDKNIVNREFEFDTGDGRFNDAMRV